MADEPLQDDQLPEPEAILAPPPRTVLLVENDSMTSALIDAAPTMLRYNMVIAHSAEQAKQLYETHAGTIDLLFTDIVMPNCSGPGLAKFRLDKTPNLKVLFTSGFDDMPVTLAELFGTEMPFIPKPFTLSEDSEVLSKMLK